MNYVAKCASLHILDHLILWVDKCMHEKLNDLDDDLICMTMSCV